MKKILITGKNSYIGTSLIKWLENKEEDFYIEEISVRGNGWKTLDFSVFDTVIHLAGIVHQKETEENKQLYYQINRDLAFKVAKKAKLEGVKQFIFLSSISVYGRVRGNITENTQEKPNSNYGLSKLQAEKLINDIKSQSFKVVIIRPPMIYGPNCKGNYTKLSKLAKITPIFPKIKTQRSMIFIYNLTEFIKWAIKLQLEGLFFPQNKEYINVSRMVKLINIKTNNPILLINGSDKIFEKINIKLFQKVFGTLVLDKSLSKVNFNYNLFNFEKTIEITEKGLL